MKNNVPIFFFSFFYFEDKASMKYVLTFFFLYDQAKYVSK